MPTTLRPYSSMIWAKARREASSPLRREPRIRGAAIKVEPSKRSKLSERGRTNLPTITIWLIPRCCSDLMKAIERSKKNSSAAGTSTSSPWG